jgi:hypothetical protein
MGLSPGKTKKIEKLLREGSLSKRAISRQEKVSRITIDRIEKRILFPSEIPIPTSRSQEYIRCKTCGGKILASVPCIVCQLQRSQIESYDNYMESLLSPSPLSTKREHREKAGR